MYDGTQNDFTLWDYAVFAGVLCISAGIGIYFAIMGRRKNTTEEFLMAGRSMSALPVALSMLASFFSASTLLGVPVEVYYRGTQYWMSSFGAMAAPLAGVFLFGPMFHKLGVVSVYEYLERRYQSKIVRRFGAALFIFRACQAMGIVLYGPSVALEAVTGFPTWAGIISVGFVSTFYTTLGGMKAVIWTDVFQTVVMLTGLFALMIKGLIDVDGFGNVWSSASDSDRIEFFEFDLDPTTRHTFWSLVIGSFFGWMMPFTVDQQMVQRFVSTKDLDNAKRSLLYNVPGVFVMVSLCSFLGMIMYAYYQMCDPTLEGRIDETNQMVPLMVLDVLGFAPGLPGLFTASLFSGALSSVSSMLNALAAVTWEDFIKHRMKTITEEKATMITKILVTLYGFIGIGIAFVVSNLGGTLVQMSLTFNGAAGAPLVGMFIMGAFFPWVNKYGALVGGVLGFAFPMWVSVGAYVNEPPVTEDRPLSTEGCPEMGPGDNLTTLMYTDTMVTTPVPPITGINQLYSISYLWMAALGICTTVVIGNVVSFITGPRDPADVDPSLMISYVDKFWCFLPESWKVRGRCGVDFSQDDQDDQDDIRMQKDDVDEIITGDFQNGNNEQQKGLTNKAYEMSDVQ